MAHKYTPEQRMFIENNIKGLGNKELTEMFNRQFNLSLAISQIKTYKGNHGLSSGLTGQFKKGQEPWNKGKKGYIGANKTSFKKGNVPANYRPVGSERICSKDGYVLIKVQDKGKYQERWKLKHKVIWEEVNGPVPEGYAIIFGDGDKTNLDIDNLILVSRSQLLQLNRHDLIKDDIDLTRTGIIIADLHLATGRRMRKT